MVYRNLLRLRVFLTFSSSSSSLRTLTSSSSLGFLSILCSSFSCSTDHRKSQIINFCSNDTEQDYPSLEKKHSEQSYNESEYEWWRESKLATKPKTGDGKNGGGVVLNNLTWGDRALSLALDSLSPFGGDMRLFALRALPQKVIFVSLDKLSDTYGCPTLEDLNIYSEEIKKRLDEAAELGEVPEDIGVKVSTPGAERLLKIPDDLHRFKDLPMRVCYEIIEEPKRVVKTQVLNLESIETEMCVWKLANVKENLPGKGRPMSRKMKDWKLKLTFENHKTVSLYSR